MLATCTRSYKANIFTVGSESLFTRSDTGYNHEKKYLNTHIINASVKRKATQDICEKPSKMIHLLYKNMATN